MRRLPVERAILPREREELREKYERMLALRQLHARARTEPGFVEPDPKPEMARLAAMFPGVLRDIDRLPLEAIHARLAELAADANAPWMIAQLAFHRHARGALAAKRWLAGKKSITPSLTAAFAHFADEEAQLFAGDLERIADPPRGRLMEFVYAKVAAALDIDERDVRMLVFG